jgi:hypothetical protein
METLWAMNFGYVNKDRVQRKYLPNDPYAPTNLLPSKFVDGPHNDWENVTHSDLKPIRISNPFGSSSLNSRPAFLFINSINLPTSVYSLEMLLPGQKGHESAMRLLNTSRYIVSKGWAAPVLKPTSYQQNY